MTLHVEHLPLSDDATARLERFASLLQRWNATVNLVAAADIPLLWERHIADCLQLVPLLQPKPPGAIDLGSGGGFPGLVLAIAADIHFALIEADQRKAAFLREAARVSAAPVTVHAQRIEQAVVPPAGLVTARALARLPRLLGLAAPKLAAGGYCLFMKGATAEAELTEAAAEWHMRVEQIQSRTNASAKILRISEIARVARD